MTEALPVRTIPEEHHVTSVRDDVVDIGSSLHASYLLAMDAERMLGQIALARLLPSIRVAAFVAGASLLLRGRVRGRDWTSRLVSWRPDRHSDYSVGGSLLAGGLLGVVGFRPARSAATLSHRNALSRRAAHPAHAITQHAEAA